MPDRDATEARTPHSAVIVPPANRKRRSRPRQPDAALPRIRMRAYLALILLVLTAFSPLLQSDLVWSEYDTVERCAYHSMPNWQAAWKIENLRQHDPLSISSYFLEQAIPLPPSTVHHGINILLHLLAAILLLKSLQALQLSAAFSATLVFALHPATIQTLFWSGYRTEIMGLIMILSALLFGIRNRNAADYAATLLFTTIGCLTHPAAYATPLILALIIFYQHPKAKLHDFNRVLPLICLGLFLSVWAADSPDATASQLSLTDRLNYAGQNMSFFTHQALLPLNRELFHVFEPIGIALKIDHTNQLTLVLLLGALPLIACNLSKGWSRALLLGLSSYLLLLLYGLIHHGQFIDGSLAHETHRLYIALPFLLAFLITALGSHIKHLGRAVKSLLIIGFGVLLLIEITLTASFAQHIAAPSRMWHSMIERWPDAWQPKAALVDHAQQTEQASLTQAQITQHLEFILQRRPDLLDKRLLLARTLRAQGQNSNATREYKRILRDTEQPDNQLLAEAADFFDTIGLRWEANNARQRMRD